MHIHGEVNPTLDGNRIVVDFNGDKPLAPGEISILIKLPGGKETLDKIDDAETKGYTGRAAELYAEARTALDAVKDKKDEIRLSTAVFTTPIGIKTKAAIDVLTEYETIEVKASPNYGDPTTKSLIAEHKSHFARFKQIFEGKLKVVHEDGTPFDPPSKCIYQFRVNNVSPQVKKWLLDRGVTEVRDGNS